MLAYDFAMICCLLLMQHVSTLEQTVSLNIPQEVVFNEKVKLECLVYGTIRCTEKSWGWTIGESQKKKLISFRGIITSMASHRYSESVVFCNKTFVSFVLEINKFSELDLNTYQCFYDFQENMVKLEWKDNVIYIPNEKEYDVRIFNEANSLEVVVNISKVYPEPICIIFLKDKEIHFSLSKIRHINKFYATVFQKQFLINQNECGAMVIIECQIGSRRVRLDQRNTSTVNCQKGHVWRFDSTSLVVGILAGSCLLCFVIGLIFCLRIENKIRKSKKNASYLKEKEIKGEDISIIEPVDENLEGTKEVFSMIEPVDENWEGTEEVFRMIEPVDENWEGYLKEKEIKDEVFSIIEPVDENWEGFLKEKEIKNEVFSIIEPVDENWEGFSGSFEVDVTKCEQIHLKTSKADQYRESEHTAVNSQTIPFLKKKEKSVNKFIFKYDNCDDK